MNKQENDGIIRQQLSSSLAGEGAHISLKKALAGFPFEHAGTKIEHLEHTAWQLVYHIWFAQKDMLDYMLEPAYQSPPFPGGYWPDVAADRTKWEQTINACYTDQARLAALAEDESLNLFSFIPNSGNKHTYFRSLVLLLDHNAYHIGQLVDLRMLLQIPVQGY